MDFQTLTDNDCHCCELIINKEITNAPFDLSPALILLLLDDFNIKIQKSETGYICFQGHNIGEARASSSSGESLCIYLKSQGCIVDSSDVRGSLLRFCNTKFKR